MMNNPPIDLQEIDLDNLDLEEINIDDDNFEIIDISFYMLE